MTAYLDHYDVLDVPPNATHDDIARRYRDLVRVHHPDLAQDKARATETLIRINLAYSVLRDPGKRKTYDEGNRRLKIEAARRTVVYSSGGPAAGTAPATPYTAKADAASSQRPAPVAPAPKPTQRPATADMVSGQPTPRHATCCEHNRPSNTSQCGQSDRDCDPSCLLNRAQAEFNFGHFEYAGDLCRRHLASSPESRTAMELLGDVYARQCDVDKAIVTYLAALHMAPRESRLRAKLQLLKASAQIPNVDAPLDATAQIDKPTLRPTQTAPRRTSILASVSAFLESIFR